METRKYKIHFDFQSLLKENEVSFLGLFILIGYMIYHQMADYYLTNPDGVVRIVEIADGQGIGNGRIGLTYFDRLFGHIVSPNLNLIIALFFCGLSLVLLARIFNATSIYELIIIGVVFLISPHVSNLISYWYCVASYALSLLLGVMACYIIHYKKNIKNILISAILVATQLFLYQAYISVTMTIAICYVLCSSLSGNKVSMIIKQLIAFIMMGIIGILSYIFSLKILRLKVSANRGFDKMGRTSIDKVRDAYHNFFQYFFGNRLLNNVWGYRRWINVALFLWIIFLLAFIIIYVWTYIGKTNVIISLICLLTFPICFNAITIFAPGVDAYGSTGLLCVPAMNLIYLLGIWLLRVLRKISVSEQVMKGNIMNISYWKYSYLFVLFPLIWNLTIYTEVYKNVMWLNYKSTYALCEKISSQIDARGLYEPEATICIVGNPEDGNYPCTYEHLRNIVKGSVAVKGLAWEGWLQNVCYCNIYQNYFNIYYSVVTPESYDEIIKSETFRGMSAFPETNSIEKIDNIIVIKLSDL